MQVKFRSDRSIYAPSSLEQRAITFLVQKRLLEARTCLQQALIEDPTRAWRITYQWEAGTGQFGLFAKVLGAIADNDLDQFEEELAKVFAEHGEPRPVNTEKLLAKARYLSCFPDEPPIRKSQPPPYRKAAPQPNSSKGFSLR